MKDVILELREAHPGWGAQTLQLEIAKDERFFDLSIPSRCVRGRLPGGFLHAQRSGLYIPAEEVEGVAGGIVAQPILSSKPVFRTAILAPAVHPPYGS